jgi:hypothetical protein
MTRPAIDIARAFDDRNLLGAALEDPTTWATWRVILKAAHGLPLDDDEAATFSNLAGGRTAPTQRVSELWCVAGRRSGKSRMAACVAAYTAAFSQHRLAPGEVGHVLVLAPSRDQAKETHGYVAGFLSSSPILRQQVESIGAEEIRLRGRISIGTHAASFRTVRGRTLLAAIFDESAFWRDETSALPDIETYRAVLPALASTNGLLVGISSPYRRIGLLHQKHRDHYGKEGDVLVIQAPTTAFNPTIDPAVIDRARANDPEAAMAEWDAQFRSDIAALLDDATIDAAIDYGRPLELPRRLGVSYVCFVDASAGRHDAFTMCVGHNEGGCFVADVIRGRRPPFDPASVAEEFAALAKDYGCPQVVGDNFSGDWVVNAFRAAGVAYDRPTSRRARFIWRPPRRSTRARLPFPTCRS